MTQKRLWPDPVAEVEELTRDGEDMLQKLPATGRVPAQYRAALVKLVERMERVADLNRESCNADNSGAGVVSGNGSDLRGSGHR